MKGKITVFLISLSLIFFVTTGFCGERDGVTKDKIRIGLITTLTGPTADYGEVAKKAAILAMEQINKTGGIHGRDIEYIMDDSAYQPAKAVAAVKKQIYRDKVFVIIGPTGSHTALASIPLCIEGKVPMIEPAGLSNAISDPFNKYIFHAQLTAGLDAHSMWKYVMENFDPKPRTVGILTYQGAYGKSKHEHDLRNAEEYGVKVVADEWCQWGDVDYTTQILKIKEANPDIFMINVMAQWGGKIIAQWKNYGMKAPCVGGNLLYMGLLYDTGGSAVDGTLVGTILRSQDDPSMAWFVDEFRKRWPDAPRDLGTGTQHYYGTLQTVFQGLWRAGRDLTKDKFIRAMETLRNFDTGVLAPVSYFPNDHRAYRMSYIYRFNEKGERVPVGATTYQHPPLSYQPRK